MHRHLQFQMKLLVVFEVGIKFRGEAAENAWQTKFAEYEAAYPELAESRLPLGMNPHTLT